MIPRRPGWAVRPASPVDRRFVRDLAARVFTAYGEYDRLVPEWMGGAGVKSLIATEAMMPVGFAVTCLARIPATREPLAQPRPRAATARDGGCLALDLMAIAIVPEHQQRGLGRWLLGTVVEAADALAATTDLPLVEVTLTVAEDNRVARHLFEAFDFVLVSGGGGTYPGGQIALQMARPIFPVPSSRAAHR